MVAPINFATGFQPAQIESPLVQTGRALEIQNAAQRNQLAQMQMAAAQRDIEANNLLNTAYQNAINPATGEVDSNKLRQSLIGGGFAYKLPALEKGLSEAAEAKLKRQELEGKIAAQPYELEKKKTEVVKSKLEQVRNFYQSLDPNDPDAGNKYVAIHEGVHKDPILGPLLSSMGIKAEDSRAEIQRALATPGGLQQLITKSILGADKFIEFTAPKYEYKDIGGELKRVQVNPNAPGFDKEASTITKTESPELKEQKRYHGVMERLAADKGLSSAEQALIGKAIEDGRLDPNRVNSRNAPIFAQVLASNPNANLKELGIDASSGMASSKALAVQSAKILTAANEADSMIKVVRNYSGSVDRTQYPTINSIQNAVAKGTGDKNIVSLNTAINALVNSYARAINPTGVATVSDKNHAREIINSNYENGQLNAILDVMQEEMRIAKASPGEASAALKAARNPSAKEEAKPAGAAAAAAPYADAEKERRYQEWKAKQK